MNRRGFTLVEVLVAVIILGVVAMSLGRFMGGFLHAVGTSSTRTAAVAVAEERLDSVRVSATTSTYATLVASFNNSNTTGFPGYPNMVRATRVVRTTANNPRTDFTTITVTVSEPTMGTPVNLTTVVAAP